MKSSVAIGEAARLTGLSVKAVRFYESAGYVPKASRTQGGYRLFSVEDVRRLRFIRRLRQLGVPLRDIGSLLSSAFTSDCDAFIGDVGAAFEAQRTAITDKIRELEALRAELEELASHVAHCHCEPGQTVRDCAYCPILDEKGGECDDED